MTYLSELKHFQLNQFNGGELLTFNEKLKLLKDSTKRHRGKGKSKSWWNEVCRAYLELYCDKASIHGIRFLTDNSLLKFEKIIWAIILLTTTIVCAYVYKLLSERYQSTRIHTIVEDSVLPVFFIPFPSIAICTRYRFNWSKMPAAEVKFLPRNPSRNTSKAFRSFFQRFEEFQFGKFEYFENLEALDLELINNISIIDVMRFLTYTCEELFGTTNGTCLWRKRVYNCCELFKLERTEYGFCHVFNSIILPAMRERALMVKKTDQWSSDSKFINPDTYTRVAITPQYTDSRSEIRTVSVDVRKCLFDDEIHHRLYKKIPGLKYWRANCRAQCHHDYIMKYCNCSLTVLFPDWVNTSYSPCKPKDYICLYRNKNVFSSEKHQFEDEYIEDVDEQMMCSCMNSCDSMVFSSSVISVFKTSNQTEAQYLHLDVFYNADYMVKYVTILSYTYVELIGNFGGIIGLFLGASLLSAVEFIYYLTIGFGVFVRQERTREAEFKLKRMNFKVRPMQEGKIQNSRKILPKRF